MLLVLLPAGVGAVKALAQTARTEIRMDRRSIILEGKKGRVDGVDGPSMIQITLKANSKL